MHVWGWFFCGLDSLQWIEYLGRSRKSIVTTSQFVDIETFHIISTLVTHVYSSTQLELFGVHDVMTLMWYRILLKCQYHRMEQVVIWSLRPRTQNMLMWVLSWSLSLWRLKHLVEGKLVAKRVDKSYFYSIPVGGESLSRSCDSRMILLSFVRCCWEFVAWWRWINGYWFLNSTYGVRPSFSATPRVEVNIFTIHLSQMTFKYREDWDHYFTSSTRRLNNYSQMLDSVIWTLSWLRLPENDMHIKLVLAGHWLVLGIAGLVIIFSTLGDLSLAISVVVN